MIRQHGDWMCALDERILEYLDEVIWSEPRLMAKFGPKSASPDRIKERCLVLSRVEYVQPTIPDQLPEDTSMWELTTRGELYLNGELDAEQYRPLPSPRPPEAVRPRRWGGLG